jgi:hypothetical protein
MKNENTALKVQLAQANNELNRSKNRIGVCEEIMEQLGSCLAKWNLHDPSRTSSLSSESYTISKDDLFLYGHGHDQKHDSSMKANCSLNNSNLSIASSETPKTHQVAFF